MKTQTLRLGVMAAVTNRSGALLLSRRADLNVWTLPGGRLDAGEWLHEAAEREAREETGITAQIGAPLGLYYLDGWRRMNIVFAAQAAGGSLYARTDETRGSSFFHPEDMPTDSETPALPLHTYTADALSARRPPPRILTTAPDVRRRMQIVFARRYVWNWLRGRLEPRYPAFEVWAAALIWDEAHARILTLRRSSVRTLPRVRCDGRAAPWMQLAQTLRDACGLTAELTWVGIWQDAARDKLEFVFAASAKAAPIFRAGEWTTARSAALPDRDAQYVARTKADYAHAPVWTIRHDAALQPGEVIVR
jgi:ADP-ribose pyrophosphatase YjhB (NUDIX family)